MKKLITISILTSSMLMALDMPTPKESYKADFAVNGINFKADVSKNNTLGFSELTCENGSAGVSIKASTTKTDEVLTFNSCTGDYVITKPRPKPETTFELATNLMNDFYYATKENAEERTTEKNGYYNYYDLSTDTFTLGSAGFLYNARKISTYNENGTLIANGGIIMRDVNGDGINDYTYKNTSSLGGYDSDGNSFDRLYNSPVGSNVELPDYLQNLTLKDDVSIVSGRTPSGSLDRFYIVEDQELSSSDSLSTYSKYAEDKFSSSGTFYSKTPSTLYDNPEDDPNYKLLWF